MASLGLSVQAGNVLLDRVTALDRSSEAFSLQVIHAHNILGFSLPEVQCVGQCLRRYDPKIQYRFGPKEEWTLRWLLKRLNVDEIQPGCPSLHSEAWILLEYLIRCCPTNITARHLKSQDFILVLDRALKWLNQHGIFEKTDHDTLAASQSTSWDVVDREPPFEATDNQSKKRKRGLNVVASPQSDTTHTELFYAICNVVSVLKLMVETANGSGVADFAAENLKSAVKSTTEIAANMLGNALDIALQIGFLREFPPSSTVLPIVWIWESRINVTDEQLEEANFAFSTRCLIPTLRTLTPSPSDATYRRCLENLLTLHCVLPARNEFQRHKSPKDRTPDIVNARLNKFTSSISDVNTSVTNLTINNSMTASDVTKFDVLPVLYEIVAKSLPRESLLQSSTEASWIRAMFDHIMFIAFIDLDSPLKAASTSETRAFIRTMLQITRNHSIKLEHALIESILVRFSGISETATEPVDWIMIGLCIDLEPDIVVTKSSIDSTSACYQILQKLDKCVYNGPRYSKPRSADFDQQLIPDEKAGNYEGALWHVVIPFMEVHSHHRAMAQFLSCWREHLETCENSQNLEEPSSKRTQVVWEDQRLITQITSSIEDTLTSDQILRILRGLPTALESTAQDDLKNIGMLRATAIVARCIFNGVNRASCITCLLPVAENLYKDFRDMILIKHSYRLTSVSWSLQSLLCQKWPQMKRPGSGQDDALANEAERMLSLTMESDESSPNSFDYETTLYAFTYLMTNIPPENSGATGDDHASRIIARLILAMERQQQKSNEKKFTSRLNEVSWDGALNEVDCHPLLLLACSTLLTSDSMMLPLISADSMKSLLVQLYNLALSQTKAGEKQIPRPDSATTNVRNGSFSWTSLWTSLAYSNVIAKELRINDVFRRFKLRKLADACSGSDEVELAFNIANLQQLQFDTWTREQRVAIENLLTSRIMLGSIAKVANRLRVLQILVILMESPSKDMSLIKDPVGISWRLFNSYNELTTAENQTSLPLLRRLLNKAFIHTMKQPRELPVNDAFLEKAGKAADIALRKDCSLSSVSWICCSLQLLKGQSWNAIDKVQIGLEKALELTLRKLAKVKHLDNADADIAVLVDCLTMLESFMCTVPAEATFEFESIPAVGLDSKRHTWDFLETLALDLGKKIGALQSNSLNAECSSLIQILNKLKVVLSQSRGTEQLNMEVLKQQVRLQRRLPIKDSLHRLKSISRQFTKLSIDHQAKYLQNLVSVCQWDPSEGDLYLILKATTFSYHQEDRTDLLRKASSCIVTSTLDFILDTKELGKAILGIRVLDIALRQNSWAISQYHIETALQSIAIMTSKSSTKLPVDENGDIYTCLCNLFGAILAVHRVKTGGRYHLIIIALQGLLTCLFTPYKSSSRSYQSISIPQPSWLDATNSPLLPAHASAFSRLVTSICDPSTSAVKRSKNREHEVLNDASKKARRTAGQHMQYVLMEFCKLQLKGKLAPEVRSALDAGLFAIFDSMGQEVRKTVNAALDPSSRAIFRAVYEDWKRFGKWKGS